MLLLSALLALGQTVQTASGPIPAPPPRGPVAPLAVAAVLTSRAPVIDGRDDDDVWRTGPVITEFREDRPVEGAEPPLRTEARVAYDARNLYVFVRAFDPHPDSVVRRLARRDSDVESDWITVYVDSYHDRRTGYRFSVNAAGVKRDRVLYNDGDEDDAWDGVWEAATRVDSLGWTAEIRVPLSQLRYPVRSANTFGFSVRRWISRYTAEVSWPLYRVSRPGTASQMGEVTGLTGLASPRRVELTPYVVTKNITVPEGSAFGRSQRMTMGGDLKYAVASNLTLNATMNPDFGQVEADPSVLNLGAFETFFRERRPFFVEGTGLFQLPVNCFIVNDCNTGEGLFYSRRIGRAPQLVDQYTPVDTPAAAAIVGAAKLSGRLSHGLSLGLLDAVTERVSDRGVTLEPATNYGVVRARQDLRGGESNVGLLVTGVNRALDSWSEPYLRREAYVGALDFLHRFPGKRYQLSGEVDLSRVAGSPAAILATQEGEVHYYQRPDGGRTVDPKRTGLTGDAEEFRFAKFGGERTLFETAVGRRSPGFEINDLGFLRRADEENWSTWGQIKFTKPAAFYRELHWNGTIWHYWSAGGLPTEHAFNTNVHTGLRSRWWLHGGGTLGHLGTVYCDWCARGGPAIRSDRTLSGWSGIEADRRMAVRPSLWLNYWRADGGRTQSVNVSPYLDVKVGSRLASSFGVSMTKNRDHSQWYNNYTDSTGGTHYTFAHLAQRTLSLTWRLDYTITTNMTLQVYLAPFVSKGTYSDIRELANPRAAQYVDRYRPYGDSAVAGNPGGFNYKQFRSNIVFRWEYRPGSTLFLVWQQGRQDSASLEGVQSFGGDLRDLFRLRADNALLLKASYWINW